MEVYVLSGFYTARSSKREERKNMPTKEDEKITRKILEIFDSLAFGANYLQTSKFSSNQIRYFLRFKSWMGVSSCN